MLGEFNHVRFRRSLIDIFRAKAYRLRSRSYSRFYSRGDYKTEMVTYTRFDSGRCNKKYVTNYQGFATTEHKNLTNKDE